MFVCCIATHLWCLKFCNPNQLSWCTFFYSEKCITLNETGLVSTTNPPPSSPKRGLTTRQSRNEGVQPPKTQKGADNQFRSGWTNGIGGTTHLSVSIALKKQIEIEAIFCWKKNKVKSIHSIGPLHLPMFIVNRLRFFSEKIVKPKIEVWKALLSAENTITTKGFATPIQVTRYIWSVVISVTGLWNKKFAIFPNSA